MQVCMAVQAYQSPYLLTVRAPGRGGRNVVIDAGPPCSDMKLSRREIAGAVLYDQACWSWPGMFAHLANDGRHSQRINRCNSQVQARGHHVCHQGNPSPGHQQLRLGLLQRSCGTTQDHFWVGRN